MRAHVKALHTLLYGSGLAAKLDDPDNRTAVRPQRAWRLVRPGAVELVDGFGEAADQLAPTSSLSR